MPTTANLASSGINNGPNAVRQQQEFHRRALLPTVVIFLALSYISIFLRLSTRKYFLKKLGWDDYIVTVSLIFFSVYCGTVLAMFSLADGARGIQNVPTYHGTRVASLFSVAECFYILSIVTLKLSLAIFFLRILTIPWQRWIIITTITLSTVFGIINVFFAIFQCGYFSNITVFVDRLALNKCASQAVGLGINHTHASLATISDWAFVLVPIFVIRKSKMPTKRRIVVGGLMVFASLGSIASVVRLCFLHDVSVPTDQFFVKLSTLSIWSTIEPGVGITVASLATLRPLFSSLVEKTRRPCASCRNSPHKTWSGDNPCKHSASSRTYTGDGSFGTSSDTTVVALSPTHAVSGPFSQHDKRTSAQEKIEDIEAEMRAYGMSDLDKSTTIDDEGSDQYTPEVRREKEMEKRMRWFQAKKAARHASLRESRELILSTSTPSRPPSQHLSTGSRRISGGVEGWRDGVAADRHGSVDCSTCHSLHQDFGESQEKSRYSNI